LGAWDPTFVVLFSRVGHVTIDEAERIEDATSSTWRAINPLRSAKHARAILETFLVSRAGMTAEDARSKVGALTVDEFGACLTFEEDDADLPAQYVDGFPQKAAGSSTPS
jgi:hypothetical protein